MSGWRRIEAALGVSAALFLGVVPWATALTMTLSMVALEQYVLAVLSFAFLPPAIAATLWVHRAAKRHLDRSAYRDPDCPPAHFPLALSMALQFPVCPTPSRWVLAAWWTIHFIGGAAAAHLVFVLTIQPAKRGDPLSVAALLVVQLAFTFAANLYLMLACGALWPLSMRLCSVWRHRLLIDVAVVAALTAVWR